MRFSSPMERLSARTPAWADAPGVGKQAAYTEREAVMSWLASASDGAEQGGGPTLRERVGVAQLSGFPLRAIWTVRKRVSSTACTIPAGVGETVSR